MEICDADGREDDIALGAVKLSFQDVGSLGTKATKNDLAGETKLGERGIEGKKHPGWRGHLMYAYGVCATRLIPQNLLDAVLPSTYPFAAMRPPSGKVHSQQTPLSRTFRGAKAAIVDEDWPRSVHSAVLVLAGKEIRKREGLRVDAHHPEVAEYGDMGARAEWPAWARSRGKGSPKGPASPMERHEGGNHVCQCLDLAAFPSINHLV